MSLCLRKPVYSHEPISSLSALSRALRINEAELLQLAAHASALYRAVKPKVGSDRKTFDARGNLKAAHRSLQRAVLMRVVYPDYLHGSIKGRDYVTNARLHTGKQILICEDVKKFFPSVNEASVYDIWSGFFRFAPPVARLLTQLTLKDGALPQGGIPSSYLANLVLWRHEPALHAKFEAMGITYSRYVDDIALSASRHLSKAEQKQAIGDVYGMLRRQGLTAGRGKHEIYTATKPMVATKLIVNRKPAQTKARRSAIRSAVFQLERAVAGNDGQQLTTMADKASQRVGQLGRFHPVEAAKLRTRVASVRELLGRQPPPTVITGSSIDSTVGQYFPIQV